MSDPARLLQEFQQENNIFSEDELRILEDGGLSVSESEQMDSDYLEDMYKDPHADFAGALSQEQP